MIKVSHLTKRYGKQEAVSDLNFTLETGKIYVLLGPNGAGKSTTMNLLTGCLAPTSGTVSINGLDIYQDAKQAKVKLGYLPEVPPVYPDMTVTEYLRFVGQARRIEKAQLRAQIDTVMAQTHLTGVSRKLIKTLSKGYRQRVGIAQALIGDPEVIILDEPTAGLDPKQITETRELITSLGGTHTVLLSSHILSEVQAVCDHILILDHGKLRANGTPESLEHKFEGRPKLILTVRAEMASVLHILNDIPGIYNIAYHSFADGTASVELETDGARNEQVFQAFSKANCPILQMNEVKVSLEDIFLKLTQTEEQEVTHDSSI